MSVPPPCIPSTAFLRLPQVLALVPFGKSSWWEGRFHKPVKLGPRTTVWRAEDIRAFIESHSQDTKGEK